jgi:hypothetical protein
LELARREPIGATERAELAGHLRKCHHCLAASERQERLTVATQALSVAAVRFTAPPALERVLLAEFEDSRGLKRRRFAYAAIGGAIAATLGIVWWMAPALAPRVTTLNRASIAAITVPASSGANPPPVTAEHAARKRRKPAGRAPAEPERPFIAIPYTLPLESYERVDVLHLDVPIAALIAVGYPTGMMDPAALARADVLVGQDGRARAIRLISVSTVDQ